MRVLSEAEPEPQPVVIRCFNDVGSLLSEATTELTPSGPVPFVRSEQNLVPLAFKLVYRLEGWFSVPVDCKFILVDGPNDLGPEPLVAHQSARVEQASRFSGPRFSMTTHLRVRSGDVITLVSKLPGGREGIANYQLLLPP